MSGLINSAGSKSGVIGTTELEYEYGTWTGTFTDGSNNTGMDNNTGSYVRIGNSVTILGYFVCNNIASASGEMYLSGLPFASNTIGSGAVAYGIGLNGIPTGGNLAIRIVAGQTYLTLDLWDTTTGTTQLTSGELGSAGRIQMSATYTIN